jgi:hypothetical protein
MANLIVGLICLALGAWGVTAWWDEFGEVLRGLIPVVFIVVGLAAIGAGVKRPTACQRQDAEEGLDAPADSTVRSN